MAYYIALNRKIKDFNLFIDGKFLSYNRKLLDSYADRSNVKTLLDFFSFTKREAIASMVSFDMPRAEAEKLAKPVHWSTAKEGLATIQALIHCLSEDHISLDEKAKDELMYDLKDFERVLLEADEKKRRWRLLIDY